MKISTVYFFLFLFITGSVTSQSLKRDIIFCGSAQNDMYRLMALEHIPSHRYDNVETAVKMAKHGDVLFITADNYPAQQTVFKQHLQAVAQKKQLRIFWEYPATLPDGSAAATPVNLKLERGVVTSDVFGSSLQPMRILGLNDAYVIPLKSSKPLIVMAKVAGFDKAEYGLDSTEQYPLLLQQGNLMISSTKLTNFTTGRYGPSDAWKTVWRYILQWGTGKHYDLKHWPEDVKPAFGKNEILPANAKLRSIEKGVQWFYNGRFFVHPQWKEKWLKNQGDGTNPIGAPLSQQEPNGDGSLGLLEGHASKIYYNGSQQYRYWLRADVQGEAAFALSSAGKLLAKPEYNEKALNLINFVFSGSNLRAGSRNDPNSPSYGLIGWSLTHPGEYYGDDNARAILGILGASANMHTGKWDQQLVEAIVANFRTTGKYGFRGNRLKEQDLVKLGWKSFQERDVVNPAPHFESWMWALYLWLYDKTGYKPFLEKTEIAIKMTMDAYPNKWIWTNGIQQERARIILPLAWLVRVSDTQEHRRWLDMMVQEILKNQDVSGAIREELGSGTSRFGRTRSNKEYGLREAPLIFTNGDPVADMLYTTNFAFFSLNEAARATGNPQYKAAVAKLSDFLTRIQVRSTLHPDLDGAWFRAFEYNRWEYWASNADVGWGAWGTLTGWTQSWIVATQSLVVQEHDFWDLTRNTALKANFDKVREAMLDEKH